ALLVHSSLCNQKTNFNELQFFATQLGMQRCVSEGLKILSRKRSFCGAGMELLHERLFAKFWGGR
ncbi:hypothetical protein, partial [Pseudomonas syringae group genomosp. 7]|uniref:hypothetical protein n=1 Tax=Pseudomonas syringae group genomosp. 7 TaxID=251699 RepID=UPI0037703C73